MDERWANGFAFLLNLYSNLFENLLSQFTLDSDFSYVGLYFLFLGMGLAGAVVDAIQRPLLRLVLATAVELTQCLTLIMFSGARSGQARWPMFVFIALFLLQVGLLARQYKRAKQPDNSDIFDRGSSLYAKCINTLSAVGLPTLFLFFHEDALQRTPWFETLMTIISTIVTPSLNGFLTYQTLWMAKKAEEWQKRRGVAAITINKGAVEEMGQAFGAENDESPLKLPMPFRVHYSLLFNVHHGIVVAMYIVTIVNFATFSGPMPDYDRDVSITLITINSIFVPCVLFCYSWIAWSFLKL
jgi:hypothetical protein